MQLRTETLFSNPVWHALQTKHRHFAISVGDACRYPAEVAPFAAVFTPSVFAMRQLRSLVVPEESVWLIGKDFPSIPGLYFEKTLDCLQMVLPLEVAVPELTVEAAPLTKANAQEMLALINLTFPGFFRSRTCEMGAYYSIRSDSELVSMGGERLMIDGYPEISGVCTHPAHRGRGYATNLVEQLIKKHRREESTSWLHVGIANRNAIELYLGMGFKVVGTVTLHQVFRRD